MKRLLIFLFFISFYGNSQYYEQKSGRVLCEAIGRGFSSETIADEALKKILSVINASKRFVIQSCDNVDNAMAVTVDGIRFIYYNKKFMNDINSATNYWSNMSMLAHEVGHHINGHTLIRTSLPESRKMELEADEFSGFILAKLGATLTEAYDAVALLSSNEDDTYSSHPSRSKRIAAIKKGYNNGSATTYKKSSSSKIEEHLHNGYEKVYDLKDYYGGIADYTKAIELDPTYSKAYYNRGNARYELKDYYGAIGDYTKAIELDPTYSKAYSNRGNTKYNLKDNYAAIADYNKAIELDPTYTKAYYNRGNPKFVLKDYYGAITDYTKAIELNPNYASAYSNRGLAYFRLNDKKRACEDWKKANSMENTNAQKNINSYCN